LINKDLQELNPAVAKDGYRYLNNNFNKRIIVGMNPIGFDSTISVVKKS